MFGVPILNFGIEASYSLTPIIYNAQDLYSQNYSKQIEYTQFYIGSVIKVNLTGGSFIPYLRVGTGLYTGSEKVTWGKEAKKIANDSEKILQDYKSSLKNKIGMNLGGGFSLALWRYSGLFFEYVYHIISRQENIPGGLLFKADNWTFSFGYVINFL